MSSKEASSIMQQFRWVFIFYHAMKESYRHQGQEWFNSMKECEDDANKQEFDYCCAVSLEYESRVKTPGNKTNSYHRVNINTMRRMLLLVLTSPLQSSDG